jgi:predicted phage terminase large subunit-like protein
MRRNNSRVLEYHGFTKEEETLLAEPWRIYPHHFASYASERKWKPYRHLKYISAIIGPAIQCGGARYIVTVPPRHGKSEFISNWTPSWYISNNPEKRVILASYAAKFAEKWGAKVKENLTQNPLIRMPMNSSSQAKSFFMTKQGGGMMTAGMGGPITGSGADLFIIDDPIKNYQEAMSPTIRERHKDWFKSVALTRLEPGASVVILLTRWHEDDLAGWILSGQAAREEEGLAAPWTLINMPALAEEGDILGRTIGEGLCPERYSTKNLISIKADLEGLIWNALYQQRPAALEGNVVLREWLKFYSEYPTDLEEKALFVDLSFKDGPATDFTSIECWGRKGTTIYLLDQIRARMGFPDQIKALKEMCRRHPDAYMKQIEEAANGAAIMDLLRDEIPGLVPFKPMTSKEARLAAVSPLYQAGNVVYPTAQLCPWVDVNIQEILTFPNGTHDDTVDCASLACAHLGRAFSSVERLVALGKW